MQTFRDVIALWPTVAAFASAIGVGERTAFSWRQRNSIPADRFVDVVRSAAAEGRSGVTHEFLASLAAARRLQKDAERALPHA